MSRTVFTLAIELEKDAAAARSPKKVAAALRVAADDIETRGIPGIFGMNNETIVDELGKSIGWYAIQVTP